LTDRQATPDDRQSDSDLLALRDHFALLKEQPGGWHFEPFRFDIALEALQEAVVERARQACGGGS
jgi:hypothetical protein